MANKRRTGAKTVSAWVDQDMLRKIDALVKARADEVGKYPKVHRSDVVKMVLEDHLDTYLQNMKNQPKEDKSHGKSEG